MRSFRLLLLAAGLYAAPSAHAQTAGETSLSFSAEFGPRMGVSISLKTFVADQVALRCTASANAGIYGASCGAQQYGAFSDQSFVGIDIGGTTVLPPRREGEPFPRPQRFVFASAAAGVQGRWQRLEEIRPYIAVGPALAIGRGTDVIAESLGLPSLGRVQPLYSVETGLEFFAISH